MLAEDVMALVKILWWPALKYALLIEQPAGYNHIGIVKRKFRCDYPYVRDESGRCILVSDCPSGQPTTPTPSSEPNYNQRCEKLNCKEGTRCILEGSKMHCGVNASSFG